VLPAAVTTGIAWARTRGIIDSKYELEFVMTSHDADKWSFSENTELSEVLIVARKRTDSEKRAGNCTFINLWRNPTSAPQALAIAHLALSITPAAMEEAGDSVSPIQSAGVKWGEVISLSREVVAHRGWIGGAFAQTDLTRCLLGMTAGTVRLPGAAKAHAIHTCPLGDLATLGPDRRDIADGFTMSSIPTPYPAFWGHDADVVISLAAEPNRWLSPRARAATGRPLRDASLLWGRSGRLMFAERMWLYTQRLIETGLDSAALSNVWWPAALRTENERHEKALVLWFNSTLGLLLSIGLRVPTRGPWVQFKKPTLEAMPVLDVRTLDKKQLNTLATAFDDIAKHPLESLPNMATDETRIAIDVALEHVLDLPDLIPLRALLAREPVVCNASLGAEVLVEEHAEQFELPGIMERAAL